MAKAKFEKVVVLRENDADMVIYESDLEDLLQNDDLDEGEQVAIYKLDKVKTVKAAKTVLV